MDGQLFVQSQAFTLSGSGAVLGAVTIVLQSMKDIDGVNLLITNFGSKGWCTLEPDNGTQEEQISFTGITQNANGTATLTGVKSVAFKSPYTETAGLLKTHPGGSKCVVSNTAAFYDSLTSKSNDETIAGIYTFVQSPVVPTGGTGTQAANANDIANAITGVSGTATNLVAGTTKLSVAAVAPANPIAVGNNDTRVPTQGENDALVGNNGTPATANKYVTQSGLQYGAEVYAADAGASDTYVITLSPAIAAYAIGQTFHFKANTANTGAATLNVNGRGAIAIVKNGNVALNDNDILAGQICTVVYDGTNFQLQDRLMITAAQGTTLTGGTSADSLHTHPLVVLTHNMITGTKNGATGAETVNYAHGLGVIPKLVKITAIAASSTETGYLYSFGTFDGANTKCLCQVYTAGAPSYYAASIDTTKGVYLSGVSQHVATASVTFDATNITLVWASTLNSNIQLLMECYAN